jgi:hypothetical protein
VDRITLRKGKGYTFKQTAGGTTLNIKNPADSHPWEARTDGVNIFITVGNIWGKGIEAHPNATLFTGSGYTENEVYFGGQTLFIDIALATAISTDSVKEGDALPSVLAVPAVKGYYYIEYSVFTSTKGLASDSKSTTAVGTKQFVLKHLPLTGVLPKTGIYPLCELQDDGLLVQGITSDIYYAPQLARHPFQIYITDYEGTAYAEVAMGTLCNIEANYADGTDLGDPDGGIEIGATGSVTGTKVFYLHAKVGSTASGVLFPDPSFGVLLKSGSSIPQSGNTDAYVGVGRYIVREGEVIVEQYTTGSLWGEYYKIGSKPAEFWFSRI